jgi:hypothetical protein
LLAESRRFKQVSGATSWNLQALQGPENEMGDVGGRTFLSYDIFFSSGALAGQPMNEADPHPTPHKIRLNIYLRQSTQNIIEANDGIGDPKYNFLCGNLMGSYLESRPPYLEFDDRAPDKYLFVSSRGSDDPPMDLNSLRF